MRWLLLDLVLVLLALMVLAGIAATVWRRANTLGREIRRVGAQITALNGSEQPGGAPSGVPLRDYSSERR